MAEFNATILRLVRSGCDLTPRQLCIMLECEAEPRTVKYLAETLSVAKPSITRGVDKLVELHYVERREDPKDRRSVLMVLTSKGKQSGVAFVRSLNAG